MVRTTIFTANLKKMPVVAGKKGLLAVLKGVSGVEIQGLWRCKMTPVAERKTLQKWSRILPRSTCLAILPENVCLLTFWMNMTKTTNPTGAIITIEFRF